MSKNQPGPREQQLRAMREERAKMVCKIDHDAEDALPKEICGICNPGMNKNARSAVVAADNQQRRDFRIPKGMSDAEGQAMLERRANEKKAKAKERIGKLKERLAEKEKEVIAKANEKREKKGLPPITEKQCEPEKEVIMRKKSVRKGKKARKATNGSRVSSKAAKVAAMLQRPEGCTNKEVLKATGWPTVSMPAQAKAAGLKLRKERTDAGLRYYGTAA